MKAVGVALLLFGAACAGAMAQTPTPQQDFGNASGLRQLCDSSDQVDRVACITFIRGFYEAVIMPPLHAEGRLFCLGKINSMEAIRLSFLRLMATRT